jgi:signal transduction histidine kinase
VLALVALTIYTNDIETAMITNLIATLPLALLRRQLILAAGAIAFGVLLAISTEDGTLTIAAILSLVTVLYVFASTYRRRWSVLLALPFLSNAIAPFSGDTPNFAGVLLLLLVVAAEALGDSRRQRGEAIAERDQTRQAMVDTLQEQAAMTERARIARDLHDVVAHHVSAIAVQAERRA